MSLRPVVVAGCPPRRKLRQWHASRVNPGRGRHDHRADSDRDGAQHQRDPARALAFLGLA
jgi:hypothetical protein